MESILGTIKKLLGESCCDVSPFDMDIVASINMALSTLSQIGVGPVGGLIITGENEIWDDFSTEPTLIGLAKVYIYLVVKKTFDPPTSSFVMQSIDKQIETLEWRIANNAEIQKSCSASVTNN